MKNLFDYATKELSQDAFLRWLFESYDDKELGKTVRKLLTAFCELSDDEIVTELHTTAQWNKIDISVWVTTNKRKVALFIEDKTFSTEHNQLSRYNRHIDCITEYQVYKVFYKTTRIEQWEHRRLIAVNETSPTPWCSVEIRDIVCNLFADCVNAENVILRQYAEHMRQIYMALLNTSRPCKNNDQIDFIKWTSYFEHLKATVLDDEFGDQAYFYTYRAGQYPYVCLNIKATGYDKEIPYLEIRSRDCVDNKFVARFLCYGMPQTDVNQQQLLIERIQNEGSFVCKHLKYRKKGNDIFPKQIGYTATVIVNNDEEFLALIQKFTRVYLDLMQQWE